MSPRLSPPRRSCGIAALLLAALLNAPAAAREPAPLAPAAFTPGEVLVMLRPGGAKADDPALKAVFAHHGLKVAAERRRTGGDVLTLRRPDADVMRIVRELNAGGLVRAASPDYHFTLQALPNDPMLGLQWAVWEPGDADVDLDEAWDIATGDPAVTIAIIDTGVDWTHPDLLHTVWQNLAEIPGNGLDDDGNGWIDDLHGWDAGNGDPDARPEPYFESGLDVGFHGTHCAGIAAAQADNGVGIAGAGRGCSLMGLKVNDSASQITLEAIAEAVDYAVVNGADVISMSFGGALVEFSFMQALMDDANAAGVVCVAAAGNGGDNVAVYPAALDGVIAVGATDDLDQRASFSTWGDWVDVAAPGQSIWSTVQSNYTWGFVEQILYTLYGWDGLNPYMYSDGTSMACPLVAGVCGLVRSARPDLTPDQVRDRLVATGDALVYDHPIGVKINARAALDGLLATPAHDLPRAAGFTGIAPNPFNPATRIGYTLEAAGPVHLAVYDLRGALVRTLVAGDRPAGAHEVAWDGRDDAGRAVAGGVYAVRLRAGDGEQVRKVALVK
ncbi:S8 family serine peptidase [bacterium]|nr:S8 family serine peptidase [bacterium]